MKNCIRIAFYGKGGIGKSTVAANVSASLANMGKKVLHIGCDPKSDSTRTLMGRRIPTVLDMLCEKGQICAEDILFRGYAGVTCGETGGPRAGKGCAGRAITVMAEQLESLQVFEENWDVIVYDVLGDVVCGGFAVPMRERLADLVYIITSAEFMSLYAANNIIRSIAEIQQESDIRFGGIIYNQRNAGTGKERVEELAAVTNSILTSSVSYSKEIEIAEYQGKTVVEYAPDSLAAGQFAHLAEKILRKETAGIPRAMSDSQMDQFCKSFMG